MRRSAVNEAVGGGLSDGAAGTQDVLQHPDLLPSLPAPGNVRRDPDVLFFLCPRHIHLHRLCPASSPFHADYPNIYIDSFLNYTGQHNRSLYTANYLAFTYR